VTLLVASWLQESMQSSLLLTMRSWDGPSVVVLATESTDEPEFLVDFLVAIPSTVDVVLVYLSPCFSKITNSKKLLPENMLLNIALDMSSTSTVCLSPAGVVFTNNSTYLIRTQLGNLSSSNIRPATPSASYSLANPQSYHLSSTSISSLDISPPPVIIIPLLAPFSSKQEIKDETERDLITTPTIVSRAALGKCGADQPKRLLQRHSNLSLIKFENMIPRKSLLFPIVFDRSKSTHGSTFIRLPEELNGQGCYGSISLAVLIGSGYIAKRATASVGARLLVPYAKNMNDKADNGVWSLSSKGCGCVSVLDSSVETNPQKSQRPNDITKFIRIFRRYFNRATTLRSTGIHGVHSLEPFATRFDKEQFELGLLNT